MADRTLLDLAMENPRGWRENPPVPVQPKVTFDEYGRPYDAQGKPIQATEAQEPTLGESLLNIAESPARMAVSAVTEPVNALQRLAENSVDENGHIAIPNPQNKENQQDVLTGLLSMYGGNAMNPGRLMEGAAAKSLPLDDISRLARAHEQGFDTSKIWYHGTDHDFDAFDYGKLGHGGGGDPGNPISSHGAFFSDDPEYAAMYGKNVLPVYLKGDYPEIYNPGANTPAAYDQIDDLSDSLGVLKRAGLDGVTLTGPGTYPERISFDPSNIRSTNAAFDPQNVGRNGLLFSDTGKPSIPGAVVAGAEAQPTRMYHGTGIPEDFKTFRPSDDGSFGSGVYFSTEPHVADDYANMGPNPRVIPADVSGPFASDWDFWDAYDKNGGDSAAAVKSLLEQGYSGISMDVPGARGKINITNVFKPGTVKSATTGETLFSDGKPSLMGSAVAGAEANTPVRAFHATNADFDKFDPAFTDEVGFHFGNKDQAQTRQMVKGGITSFLNPWSDWKTIPVDIAVQKPAALSRDVQHFTGARVANQLVRDGIAPPSLLQDIGDASPEQATKYVRDWLVSNGYDAVKYPNKFEGAGAPSYMALGTGNVKHAKTGDVLYAAAPPIPVSEDDQDQPLSLADLALIAGNR